MFYFFIYLLKNIMVSPSLGGIVYKAAVNIHVQFFV